MSSSDRTCNSRFHTRAIAIAAAAVGIDQKALGARVAGSTEHVPPAPYARDRERGSVVADAEVDPPIIGSDVVDAVWCNLVEFRDNEVMNPGCPFGRSSRPPFLKSPTSSFFLVSTEITGSPAALNALISALM
jgi:hypothetical protein